MQLHIIMREGKIIGAFTHSSDAELVYRGLAGEVDYMKIDVDTISVSTSTLVKLLTNVDVRKERPHINIV